MESSSRASFTSRFPVVKRIDVGSLRQCAALMDPVEIGSFDQAYGNLRRLLWLDVQENALAALSQFYDSDSRCFFFKNFQLSPTLEEYDQLLGFSRSHAAPYRYQGQYYSDKKLAMFLRIGADQLKEQKLERNGIAGYPQEFFEGLMQSYALTKNWGLFKLVLALTIFGVVLFPQIDRYIDEDAIGVFLAFKDAKNPINPVPAVLANTYHAFTRYRQFHKKKMCVSSHVLYAWLLIHVIHNKKEVNELISYALSCDVKGMTSLEWVELLKSLNDRQIRWFHRACWEDRPEVLFSCGDFQNVPLMGTQVCINYNPSLTLRQLGYPMRNSPSEDMLSHIYLHPGIPKCDDRLRRVQQSWESVVRKGSEELSKRISATTFSQWLKEKLQRVKTPSQGALSLEEEIPEPDVPTFEEVNEIKAALAKADEEKEALKAKLEEMTAEKEKLEEENAIKMIAVEESVKQFKKEERSKLEAQRYLRGAKEELNRCNLKLKESLADAKEWKSLWEEATMKEKALRNSLASSKRDSRMLIAELEDQMRSIKQDRDAIEGILRDYQQALKGEQERSDELKGHLRFSGEIYHQVRFESRHWEHRFMELVGKIEDQEIVKELRDETQFWKGKFSKLAEFANQAMMDIPRNLKKAEAGMHFLTTPPEVYQFVEFCRALIIEFRGRSKDAEVSRKRKRVGNFKALCS